MQAASGGLREERPGPGLEGGEVLGGGARRHANAGGVPPGTLLRSHGAEEPAASGNDVLKHWLPWRRVSLCTRGRRRTASPAGTLVPPPPWWRGRPVSRPIRSQIEGWNPVFLPPRGAVLLSLPSAVLTDRPLLPTAGQRAYYIVSSRFGGSVWTGTFI